MNPWLILAIVFALGVALVSGYGKGARDERAACEIKIAALQAESQQRKDAEAAKAANEADKVENESAKAKVKYRAIATTVDKIVERPSYRSACLDDDGIAAANAALLGAKRE